MTSLTSNKDGLVRRTTQATQAGDIAADRTPSLEWGLLAYGDASPAAGGGVGAFVWLQSREAMLEYVKRHLAFDWPGPSGADPFRVATAVEGLLLGAGTSSDADLESLRLRLNPALRGFAQIEWWGTLSDLMTGPHPNAARVRAWFRANSSGADGQEHPITQAEQEAFLAALPDFGL